MESRDVKFRQFNISFCNLDDAIFYKPTLKKKNRLTKNYFNQTPMNLFSLSTNPFLADFYKRLLSGECWFEFVENICWPATEMKTSSLAGIYLFKVIMETPEQYVESLQSYQTIKTTEWRRWRLLLTLNRFCSLLW